MATHSGVLAWRIPWTEEPGGLQSVESQSQTQLSNFHLCSSAATLASLLLLKPGDLVLASGPLHLLFCLPGVSALPTDPPQLTLSLLPYLS